MGEDRHVPLADIRAYFESGTSGLFALSGQQEVRIFVDPRQRRIGFRTAAGDVEPDLARFELISFESFLESDRRVDELSICVPAGGIEEAYSWLCAVVDRIQHDGDSAGAAVSASLSAIEGVLAKQSGLSREKQLGLFGELYFLVALVEAMGAADALDAWFGADAEEHDFRLPTRDVEVKVTSSERRRHWISSMRQLQPSEGRALAVLSVQLTPAPESVGLTLPGLVAGCARRIGDDALIGRLRDVLASVGYRDEQAVLYRDRWSLRSEPVLYPVDERFPAILPIGLEACIAQAERVVDLRYQVDLEGLSTLPCEHAYVPLQQL